MAEVPVIEWLFGPNAVEYINSEAQIVALFGPPGTQKSFASIQAVLAHQKRCGTSIRIAIIRDTLENIRISVVPSFYEFFAAAPHILNFKNENKEGRIDLGNGVHIDMDLFGCNDPSDLQRLQGGSSWSLIWINDPAPMVASANAGVPEFVYDHAAYRSTRKSNSRSRLQIDANYADEMHWTHKRLILEPDDDPETPLIKKRVFHVSYAEMTVLNEEAMQMAKRVFSHDETSRQRYVEGKFAEFKPGKEVAPGYRREIHRCPNPIDPAPGLECFAFCDGWFNPSCFSNDSSILTINGWKLFSEIGDDEVVMTLNPKTHEIEYQQITGKIAKPYQGEMLNWNGEKAIDVMVTPDHQMSVSILQKDLETIDFKSAQEISEFPYDKYCLPLTGRWIGKDPGHIVLPATENGRYSLPEKIITSEAYASFMGIYLSEGCCDTYVHPSRQGKPGNVQIAQDNRDENIELILKQTPFKWRWDRQCWRVHSIQLYSHLENLGKSADRKVPQIIKDMPSHYIKLFLNAYKLGDGSKERFRIYTASKTMANDLQEIAVKAGYSSTLKITDRTGDKNGNSRKKNHIEYIVNINQRKRGTLRPINLKRVDYNDMVYCVEVPNHIIYVRRNGKPAFCGNCVLGQITTARRLLYIDTVRAEGTDIRTLLETQVGPLLNSPRWKNKWRSWRIGGDFSMANRDQGNINHSAAEDVQDFFKQFAHGVFRPRFEKGPRTWKEIERTFNYWLIHNDPKNRPMIYLSATNHLLDKGLNGAWHYKQDNSGNIVGTEPQKDEISHVMDAWANSVCNLLGKVDRQKIDTSLMARQRLKQLHRAEAYAVQGVSHA